MSFVFEDFTMDERSWRKYLEPLRDLGVPIWRSRQEEIELAENILTGAVPWSGPPSGETSKGDLTRNYGLKESR